MDGRLSLLSYRTGWAHDETEANASDPILAQVGTGRRSTLIARRDETPDSTVYHFDIHMQGDKETVFFDA